MPKIFDSLSFLLIALITATSIYTAFTHPLLPDEAYYWLWGKDPAPGYFDHPPMIALILALTGLVGGDTLFAVRVPGILAWLLCAAIIWHLAKKLFSVTAGYTALLLFALSPAFQMVIMVTTPDTVLLVFVALYLWLLQRVLISGKIYQWACLGLLAGGIGLSKYNGIVVALALVLSLAISKQGRRILFSPGPWLAGVCAWLVISPVLLWNYHNDWVSFAFQFDHGLVADSDINPLSNLLKFSLVQFTIYLLPLVSVVMLYALVGYPKHRNQYGVNTLFVDNTVLTSLLTLALFGYVFAHKGGEHNWTAIAWYAGIIPLSGVLDRYADKGTKQSQALSGLFFVSVVMAGLLLFAFKNLHLIEKMTATTIPRTQATYAWGWQQTAGRFTELVNSNQQFRDRQCVIALESYSKAAWLAWNLRNTQQVVHFSGQGRMSQFDLWRDQRPDLPVCFFVSIVQTDEAIPEVRVFQGDNWYILERLTSHNPDDTTTHITLYSNDI